MTAAMVAAVGTVYAQKVEIIGAGASFPTPLITAMADRYRTMTDGRVTVNYQSIGSGGGIRQFGEQTIMFGMTEAFLKDDVMAEVEKKTGGKAFNMPVTLADVVVGYNLPGVKEGVVFNGEVLSDIYLGKIKKWNDKKIHDLNKDIKLPNLPITVAHRSDGSGTTNIWTSYLSKVSKEWADKIGSSTSVNWPLGVGGKGNEGVSGVVMNTPGAIGYMSYSYALLNKISFGYIINKSGNTVKPNFEATSEAANIELPEDTRILFTDTPAKNGYPVAGFCWMLVYENLEKNKAIKSKTEAEELVKFLVWAITDGQNLSEKLGYSKLPKAAIDKNKDMIKQLKWNGEEIGKKILG